MIKSRFCPSPTGLMHLGNARTALFSFLLAHKEFLSGGEGIFLLRIEDTDLARSKYEYTLDLLEDLLWLDLKWQEGPNYFFGSSNLKLNNNEEFRRKEILGKEEEENYFQSKRSHIYNSYYQWLEKNNFAYSCFCSEEELTFERKTQLKKGLAPRYSNKCRHLSQEEIDYKIKNGEKPTLRFMVDDKCEIIFNDLVKGPQKFLGKDIGDFIIRRADGSPSFLFCNAIDDSLMGVTHVLRGEDHLSNTPRQLMLLQILCLSIPLYGHIPLIIEEKGEKLSKREGALSVKNLRNQGYLSLAILNYLARLGHTYIGQSDTLFSLKELAENFSLDFLGKSPARMEISQLNYWQKKVIQSMDDASLLFIVAEYITSVPSSLHLKFISCIRSNILFPHEAEKWSKLIFDTTLFNLNDVLEELYSVGKEFFLVTLKSLPDSGRVNFNEWVEKIKDGTGFTGKKLFRPLRLVLTGNEYGPDLTGIIDLLGEDSIEWIKKRLCRAIDTLP